MANTIIEGAGLDPKGFEYALGTGWIPYLLGMEELPGKEAFQRASVGTDLFKSLTDFMTNPTAGPLGLAATAAYGGPQGISAGTQGKGLESEIAPYRNRFNTLLDNLMGFSGTMNAQPEDTQYVAPPVDPNKAPAPTPENAAKAPNVAQDWIKAWEAYNPGQQHPGRAAVGLIGGGIVDMILRDADRQRVEGFRDGGEKPLPTGTPTPGAPAPTGPVAAPHSSAPPPPVSIKPPSFEGSSGQADPMNAYGGAGLVEAMQKYVADRGGDPKAAGEFVQIITAISKMADLVRQGKIMPYTGQPPIPGQTPPEFTTMPQSVIKNTLRTYGSQVGFTPPKGFAQGGGVVVGGQPHFVVDASGNPVAAITEDGAPEAVTGTPNGFEVTPMQPDRRAAYEQRKRQNSMGAALADADDFMARMTDIPHAATGASMMLPSAPKTYVGDSMAHPSGVPVPTIGGPGQSREEQVGKFWKPKTGAGAPSLMEQMASLPGNYNEQFARMMGGALGASNMAVPAEDIRALSAGRAPDKLLSAQALSTMSPSQRKGYAAMLKQMGIVQSDEDLDYAVNQFRPAGLKAGGRMRLGGGGRFAKLKASLEGDVRDPGAVAASIGRKKYGAKKMAKMAAAGRKK